MRNFFPENENSDNSEKTTVKDVLLYIVCGLIITVCIFSVLFVYLKKSAHKKDNSTSEVHGYKADYVLDPTSDDQFIFWDGIEVSEEATTTVEATEMPEKYDLKLSLIEQNPELPSGCEAVALTMLLNYYGYNLDKTTIADNYLIFSDDNFVMGFKGNPHNKGGGGAYAPSIANTANRFLIQQGSELRAINASGYELEELFPFIAGGTPVAVWTTIDLNEPKFTGPIYQYGNTQYQWVTNEHCVILTGYDLVNQEITIYDSLSGIKTYPISDFKNVYDKMWKMAVILQ